MRVFYLKNFRSENDGAKLTIPGQGRPYQIDLASADANGSTQGFFLSGMCDADFVVATNTASIDGIEVPRWENGILVGLNGNLYSDQELLSPSVLDLVFLRRFRVGSASGELIVRWYWVAFPDWLTPADPIVPWGRDFYKYLAFLLSKPRKLQHLS